MLPQQSLKEITKSKTCVIDDPLGQTHSPTSSDHYFYVSFVRQYCEKQDRMYVRMESTYGNNKKTNDHYRPELWVGRVDQKCQFSSIPYPPISPFYFLQSATVAVTTEVAAASLTATQRAVLDVNKRNVTRKFVTYTQKRPRCGQ